MNTLTEDVTDRAGLAEGRALGRYRIGRVLGAGSMGVVYEALHLDLRKRVAIKVLRREFVADDTARRRFLREGEAAARVRHPHVVDVSDVGHHAGLPFLVMELLEGEDLETLLRREGRLGVELTLELMLPVVAGVAAGHDRGVIHCDLKPRNIFLSRQDGGGITPKVLDFGVSKRLDPLGGPAHLTAAGAIFGTVQYFAPEQARGGPDIGPATDQYALGAILAECLTGERSFMGDNAVDILRRICQADFAPPRARCADLPSALEAVILRAMSLEPGARFAALYALGAALLPFSSSRSQVVWETTFKQTVALVTQPVDDVPEDDEAPVEGRAPDDAPSSPATIDVSEVISSELYDEDWEDDSDHRAWEAEASPIAAAAWSDDPDPLTRSGQTLLLPPDAWGSEAGEASMSRRRLATQRIAAPPAPERVRPPDVAARAATFRTLFRGGVRHQRVVVLGTLGLVGLAGVLSLRPASPRSSQVEPSPPGAVGRARVSPAPQAARAPRGAPSLATPVFPGSPRAFDPQPPPQERLGAVAPSPALSPASLPAPMVRAAEASPGRPVAEPRARGGVPRVSRARERRAVRSPSRKNARPRVLRTINHAPVVE